MAYALGEQLDVFRAVADPTRRAILDFLEGGERAVHEFFALFTMSQPALSKHLRVLLRTGLVGVRKVGRERLYRLEATRLKEVAEWVLHYERFWKEKLNRLGGVLDEMS